MPHRSEPTFKLALIAAFHIGSAAIAPVDGEELFVSSLEEAQKSAESTGRLVLVAHLPLDAPTEAVSGDGARFIKYALNDAIVHAKLAKNFVGYLRTTGTPRMIRERGGHQTTWGQPIIYFCTTDLRVVHFAVGFITPETIQSHANWASSAYQTMCHELAIDRPSARNWMHAAHREMWGEKIRASIEFGDGVSDQHIHQVLLAAVNRCNVTVEPKDPETREWIDHGKHYGSDCCARGTGRIFFDRFFPPFTR